MDVVKKGTTVSGMQQKRVQQFQGFSRKGYNSYMDVAEKGTTVSGMYMQQKRVKQFQGCTVVEKGTTVSGMQQIRVQQLKGCSRKGYTSFRDVVEKGITVSGMQLKMVQKVTEMQQKSVHCTTVKLMKQKMVLVSGMYSSRKVYTVQQLN